MSLITQFENNSMRKSYRTSLPLKVVLNGEHFNAIDWSLTGLALKDLPFTLEPGEKIKALLILPMYEATLSLPVMLLHEYTEKGRSGFSFIDLSSKNKNVMRRFIELAISGKIDRVDDIIAVYEEPHIETPIQTPVILQEDEAQALKVSFLRTSVKYILFAFVIFGLLGLLLFYNMRYTYEGSGIVKGNDLKIYPHVGGMVEKLYVKEHDIVKEGAPLVQIDSSKIEYRLALLEVAKERERNVIAHETKRLQKSEKQHTALLKIAKRKVARTYNAYKNAKAQYASRLITASTLLASENAYIDAKLSLEKIKAMQEMNSEKEPENPKSGLQLDEINVKSDYLKKQLALYHISAPVDGEVYEIYVREGEEAAKSRPLLLLWTADEAYIVANIPNSHFSDISVGTKVDIVDRNENSTFHGKVYKTGNINESFPQNDTFMVYIKPEKTAHRLKPHQRVELLFKREF
jgi:membrane fusion protein (multidrug efflux system)